VAIQSLDELLAGTKLTGRRVFVRADLNVPLDSGEIRDDSRIRASLPTLERLRDAGARTILASHLGRPKGKVNQELSLAPVARALSIALGRDVAFAPDCVGPEVEAAAAGLEDGDVLLLENLRFHKAETNNDEAFARSLAALAEIYVNDAFGTAHRAHASTAGMVPFMDTVAAGLLLQKEIDALGSLLDPSRPFVCFLGGAKVSDKMGVLEALIERADTIGVGGAMAYTFMAAAGEPVGASLIEPDRFEDARRMRARAVERGCELLLPSDHVVADRLEEDASKEVVREIPDDRMGVDIGPATAERYARAARGASTILWNGPMGVFEIDAFSRGTERVAQGVAASEGRSVVGGGDSLAAVAKVGLGDQIDHLSTGGGASLEFVQGLELPGIRALDRAP
jgi:phosphoglycerate kinase